MEESIKLNINIDMTIKNVKNAELNRKTENGCMNTQASKMIY